jgi:uncharacterized protein YegP (UPF0339 family)
MSKFEIKTRTNGEYQFNLKAGNGEIILTSEGYVSKAGCENGIESVRKNSPDDHRYDQLEAKNGKFYFNLKATNGQIIGSSQMYESKSGRDSGIESVKKNGPIATIDDQTV